MSLNATQSQLSAASRMRNFVLPDIEPSMELSLPSVYKATSLDPRSFLPPDKIFDEMHNAFEAIVGKCLPRPGRRDEEETQLAHHLYQWAISGGQVRHTLTHAGTGEEGSVSRFSRETFESTAAALTSLVSEKSLFMRHVDFCRDVLSSGRKSEYPVLDDTMKFFAHNRKDAIQMTLRDIESAGKEIAFGTWLVAKALVGLEEASKTSGDRSGSLSRLVSDIMEDTQVYIDRLDSAVVSVLKPLNTSWQLGSSSYGELGQAANAVSQASPSQLSLSGGTAENLLDHGVECPGQAARMSAVNPSFAQQLTFAKALADKYHDLANAVADSRMQMELGNQRRSARPAGQPFHERGDIRKKLDAALDSLPTADLLLASQTSRDHRTDVEVWDGPSEQWVRRN